MKEELDKIIEYINSSNLSLNAKIRYAYIELGKLVQKDAMFFYTIQSNLIGQGKENIKYSFEEIRNKIGVPNNFDYKVVCRTVAEMLQYIFENCNIESEIRKTIHSEFFVTDDGSVEVSHYFLSVTGEEGKHYALTLNPDLPNIQIGKQTSHFGNIIEYKKDKEYVDENGVTQIKTEQVYEGDEIDFTPMTFEQIELLDIEIGYLKGHIIGEGAIQSKYTDYYFQLLKAAYSKDKEYYRDLIGETQFYYDVCKLLNGEQTLDEILERGEASKEEKAKNCIDFRFEDKTPEEWEDFKKFVILSITSKFYNEYSLTVENESNLFLEYLHLIDKKAYDDIFNMFKKDFFTKGISSKELNKMGELNPLNVFRYMLILFKSIDNYEQTGEIDKQKFMRELDLLSLNFVEKKYFNEKNSSSTYIAHKIVTSFDGIFDLGNETQFSKLGIAEQVTIIKEVLEIIFNDLKTPNPNLNKSAIKQRVLMTTIFNKETKQPYYFMCVKNTAFDDNIVPIIFDLSSNRLIINVSLIDIYRKFYIIKDDDLKLLIENIERGSAKEYRTK